MYNSNSEKLYQKIFPGTLEKREKIMASLANINLKYKKPSFLRDEFNVDIEKEQIE